MGERDGERVGDLENLTGDLETDLGVAGEAGRILVLEAGPAFLLDLGPAFGIGSSELDLDVEAGPLFVMEAGPAFLLDFGPGFPLGSPELDLDLDWLDSRLSLCSFFLWFLNASRWFFAFT